jgi:hypothetical protein
MATITTRPESSATTTALSAIRFTISALNDRVSPATATP